MVRVSVDGGLRTDRSDYDGYQTGIDGLLGGYFGFSHKGCAELVASFFSTLSETLAAGEPVKLSGFGNFTLGDKNPRPGRNPRNGEPCEITARRVVTFKASPKLRQQCNPHVQDAEG